MPFTYTDVVLTPGAMAALHLCLRSAGGAGREVLVPVPCWLDYPLMGDLHRAVAGTGLTRVVLTQ